MAHKSSSDLAIQAEGLFFYYITQERKKVAGIPFKRLISHRHVALDHLSLDIRAGRITALMGKNGSGKTTFIKIATGARLPHEGKVRVFGVAPDKVKSRVGLCLGASLVYHRLTARENLEYFGQLYRVARLDRRIDELAHLLRLEDSIDALVETYSFGMKAKLALARAMIHSPDLLILDEPTLGIDYQLAVELRSVVRSLKCTVLLTTHYMEEADALADDLVLIDGGRILASGEKNQVLAQYGATNVAGAFVNSLEGPPRLRSAS